MDAPGSGAATWVVKVRQDRSMFKLSKWLRKSYRRAIEANIRRTRQPDLSSCASARAELPGASVSFSTPVSAGAIMASGSIADCLVAVGVDAQPVYRDYC